jgi:hypothetical protein
MNPDDPAVIAAIDQVRAELARVVVDFDGGCWS